jgi:quinol monooxygenase YgiN
MAKASITHAVYRPKEGKEDAVLALLKKHWPTLRKEGLVTEEPALLFRATDKGTKRPYFIEIFSWRDEKVQSAAHNKKSVMAIWEPMAKLIESGRSPEVTLLERLELEG